MNDEQGWQEWGEGVEPKDHAGRGGWLWEWLHPRNRDVTVQEFLRPALAAELRERDRHTDDRLAYDISDPKHPDHHDVYSDIADGRDC